MKKSYEGGSNMCIYETTVSLSDVLNLLNDVNCGLISSYSRRMVSFMVPVVTATQMRSTASLVRLGTSGYSYGHWKGTYYPPKVDQFKFYAGEFYAVELNNPSTEYQRIPLSTSGAKLH
ncbi:hypothetical protein R1flu_025831 [Riccia fluitans]|uniref:Uncharacterized protein n=1 Tax=Riccia fluitans TaxID=41844 RepID=A0ABD1XYV7_9MARC